jgi:hypothetical protein
VVFPIGKLAGASFVIVGTPQLSVPVAVPMAAVDVHKPASVFIVTLAGHVIVGFSLSTTVTNCVQVTKFPAPSVDVHVTVVFPIGKLAGASFVIVGTPQLSVPVAVPMAAVDVHKPASVFIVTLAGHVIVGFSLSTTVTNCVQVTKFPAPSVDVHVTVVFPIGKLAGASFVIVGTPQLSVPVAVPIDAVDVHCPASVLIVTAPGQVIVGFSLSTTVTVNEQVTVPKVLVA